ncbi:MAG: 50S ribosomal protein L22 [Acidimicrobiales bacterium]
MTGPKLNESPVYRARAEAAARPVDPSPSAKAIARYIRTSPYKVRQVLDLIRGHDVARAAEILRFCERSAADVVGKVLASAVANGEHNHSLAAEDLFVSACFADEGPTLKRWRPRARGRATRIRKRTCHVTVVVSRLPDREVTRRRAERAQATLARRSRPRRPTPPGTSTTRSSAVPATTAAPAATGSSARPPDTAAPTSGRGQNEE